MTPAKAQNYAQEKLIEEKRLLTASLYEYNGMCFLYYEALEKGVIPEDFLSALDEVLETWPEEQGLTPGRQCTPSIGIRFRILPKTGRRPGTYWMKMEKDRKRSYRSNCLCIS